MVRTQNLDRFHSLPFNKIDSSCWLSLCYNEPHKIDSLGKDLHFMHCVCEQTTDVSVQNLSSDLASDNADFHGLSKLSHSCIFLFYEDMHFNQKLKSKRHCVFLWQNQKKIKSEGEIQDIKCWETRWDCQLLPLVMTVVLPA